LTLFFGENKTALLREDAELRKKSQNFIKYLVGEVCAAEQLNEAHAKSIG